MKVIVDRETVQKFIKQIRMGGTVPKYRLLACDARFFIDVGFMTTGTEALVIQEGGCTVNGSNFRCAIKRCTYKKKASITIEADETGAKVWDREMPCKEYSSTVTPPAAFDVFPVTDSWIASRGAETPPEKR